LFQQLVGDLLRERFREQAEVSPTKGVDGGIDIFLETGPGSAQEFCNLPLPIIVECKDHDDALGAVSKNIDQGWSKLQEKLARQAESGWAGTYQPWRRAHGYLYCISAVFPNKEARVQLTQSIQDFFASLPPAQKPPIEAIHVLDWSDLASRLNHHARLADAWLGTALEGIVGHETYAARLSGFRLYLKEEQLSFIPPALGDPVHPDSLFASLQELESTSPGILLIGPGGVGKTRTCFEVARCAHCQGWRVLHLLPGEPPVTASDLQEVVLQGSTPTLLVIDYLDQMGSLDFGTIRHRLLPEVQDRGMPLALLANARPGVLRKPNPEREALFRRIDLDIRDRRDRITTRIQETIAPRASEILGPAKVQELCGTRPIIGMFIARELERYAREGKLDATVASQLRPGDLQGWIMTRFREDGLVPRETPYPLLPPAPDPVMTATAASFAAAPLSQPEMFRVISDTLAAAGVDAAMATAGPLMASLERSGWLEETGYELTTPHDVIADELLELTLCDRDLAAVRPEIADQVFIGARAKPRVFGRFSVALDRVLGQKDFPEQLLQGVKDTVSGWLAHYAAEMGQAMPMADPDEVSYALGAVITGTAWSDAALRAWDDLIGPWLSVHGQRAEARHLLYRGLKELPKGGADKLAELALRWIGVHCEGLDASYVLSPLAAREDLGKEPAQSTINLALEWLTRYNAALEAGFVLPPLLAREDLGGQAGTAINLALEWLTRYNAAPDAGFVLDPLLAREDLGGQAGTAINLALEWLSRYNAALEAGFVLDPLLAREDLGGQAGTAINLALEWLEKYFKTQGAEFVLKNLLGKSFVSPEGRQRCLTLALKRLDQVIDTPEASFLLRWCLSERTLSGQELQQAVEQALRWLRLHPGSPEIDFVFKRLLRNPNLEDHVWREAADHALAWLRRTPLRPDRDHILNSLVTRLSCLTPAERTFLRQDAQTWFEAFPTGTGEKRLLVTLERLTKFDNPHILTAASSDSLGTPPTFSLSDFLREQMEKGVLPDLTQLHQGLETARDLLHRNHPGAAAYYLSSLLPLASLQGDPALIDQVEEATRRLIEHPDLAPNQRRGFIQALYRLLDRGAWHDKEAGERLLASLSIHRPPTE
jgi:hypothetical protein